MTAESVLARAQERGIVLRADGKELRYLAPAGSLDESLKSEIRENKPALLDLLTRAEEEERSGDLLPDAAYWDLLRWGSSINDPTPGIAITMPDPKRAKRSASLAFVDDIESHAERFAIAMDGPHPDGPPGPVVAFDGSSIPTPEPLAERSRELAESTLRILALSGVTASLSPDGKALAYSDPRASLSADDLAHLAKEAHALWAYVVLQKTTPGGTDAS
jgi:hypothetical protein